MWATGIIVPSMLKRRCAVVPDEIPSTQMTPIVYCFQNFGRVIQEYALLAP